MNQKEAVKLAVMQTEIKFVKEEISEVKKAVKSIDEGIKILCDTKVDKKDFEEYKKENKISTRSWIQWVPVVITLLLAIIVVVQ